MPLLNLGSMDDCPFGIPCTSYFRLLNVHNIIAILRNVHLVFPEFFYERNIANLTILANSFLTIHFSTKSNNNNYIIGRDLIL
jgi:hypothetical protein